MTPSGQDGPGGARIRWVDRQPGVGPDDEGCRLRVVEVGDPRGAAVIIAHGAGSSARFVVEAFGGPLLGAGWRLVTFDLRGHGGSGAARSVAAHHLDGHAGDLAAVAASVEGDVEVVGGVSLGGHAAVRAVARGWVSCAAVLACLPAWTGRAVAGVGPHAMVAEEVRDVGIPAVIARLEGAPDLAPWLRDTLVTDYRAHDEASLVAALVSLNGGEAPTRAEVSGLPVPLVVIGWADDPGHPLEVAQDWASTAPVGTLWELALEDLDRGIDRFGRVAVPALEKALG